MKRWIKELRKHADQHIVVMVVANKIDMSDQRQVDAYDIQQFVDTNGLAGFMEASAKSGENVQQSFEQLIRMVYNTLKEHGQLGSGSGLDSTDAPHLLTIESPQNSPTPSSGCC